jgi:hypothetical protein
MFRRGTMMSEPEARCDRRDRDETAISHVAFEAAHCVLFSTLVRINWKVTLRVHSVVQYPHDFDRRVCGRPVHQNVTSALPLSRDVDRPKTRHDLISGFGTQNIGTADKFANRLNERTLIDTRLLRAKTLGGPFYDVRKVEFGGSAEADAPSPLGHAFYPTALEMTFSERSFK